MSIYEKLEKVVSKMDKLSKDTTNPFYKSKFADLNQVIENVNPLLAENRLLLLQPIIDGHVVSKIIDIETKEEITSSIILPLINDPQKVGIAITYYRRYTLKSLLSMQEEDDDGNGYNKKEPAKKPQLPPLGAKAFEQAVERANKGEKLLSGIKEKFKLTESQEQVLKSAEEKQNVK